MNQTIRALLRNQEENHVLPFFWQHGEDEATLREMMAAIHGANCRAVCVEVFLNGESAGLQIAPPMVYRLKGRKGINQLRIEVATTLERQCYPLLEGYHKMLARVPSGPSGLAGRVTMHAAKTVN